MFSAGVAAPAFSEAADAALYAVKSALWNSYRTLWPTASRSARETATEMVSAFD